MTVSLGGRDFPGSAAKLVLSCLDIETGEKSKPEEVTRTRECDPNNSTGELN